MAFGTAVVKQVLDSLLTNAAWTPPTSTLVSLHTADPGATGGSEVTGGSYGKGSATWGSAVVGAAGGGTCTLSANVDFANMPAGTVTHFGVWTQATVWICGGTLTASQAIAAGATARLGTATTFAIS